MFVYIQIEYILIVLVVPHTPKKILCNILLFLILYLIIKSTNKYLLNMTVEKKIKNVKKYQYVTLRRSEYPLLQGFELQSRLDEIHLCCSL